MRYAVSYIQSAIMGGIRPSSYNSSISRSRSLSSLCGSLLQSMRIRPALIPVALLSHRSYSQSWQLAPSSLLVVAYYSLVAFRILVVARVVVQLRGYLSSYRPGLGLGQVLGLELELAVCEVVPVVLDVGKAKERSGSEACRPRIDGMVGYSVV